MLRIPLVNTRVVFRHIKNLGITNSHAASVRKELLEKVREEYGDHKYAAAQTPKSKDIRHSLTYDTESKLGRIIGYALTAGATALILYMGLKVREYYFTLATDRINEVRYCESLLKNE